MPAACVAWFLLKSSAAVLLLFFPKLQMKSMFITVCSCSFLLIFGRCFFGFVLVTILKE